MINSIWFSLNYTIAQNVLENALINEKNIILYRGTNDRKRLTRNDYNL